MGQHLENWEIPSVKARMIRQARGVGEACERLWFSSRFGLSKHAGRSHETSELRKERMFESSVSFLFFFAHQVEVANRRICAREQFFPIFN